MMDYKISVNNLKFGYDAAAVLKDVSLEFPVAGFVSILGPNGCGKSTLLKSISAVLKPNSGNVLLNGKSLHGLKKKEVSKIMSVVPQNTALEFDYKVMDVVMMGRYPYISRLKGETARDREIAVENMNYTNTYHLKDRSFNQLSGGERQRVILAQALTQQPKILLLDEPISHLDLQHQIEILNLIKKLSLDQNLLVIAVLHDLNMAAAYSDHIIMMKNGEIKHEGAPIEVLNASNIKDIFNIEVQVEVSVLTNKPYIYALARPEIRKNGVKVHVICGGGSGNDIISTLHNKGFDISCGVLSIGDLDWKVSKDFDLRIAEDIPFSRISQEAYQENLSLATMADYIVLGDFYVGKANVRNLEVLLEEKLSDKTVLILGDDTFAQRDITEGYASELYNRLKQKDSSKLVDREELYTILNKAGEAND